MTSFFLAGRILLSPCNIENVMCWKIQASMKFQEKLIFKRGKYCTSIKKQCRLSYIQLRESLIIESKGITTSGDNPEKTFLNAGGSVSPFKTPYRDIATTQRVIRTLA